MRSFRRFRYPVVLVVAAFMLTATPMVPAGAQAAGTIIADSGFRPAVNGFAFENYGAGPFTNLIAADIRAMFGNEVCVNPAAAACNLTPPAKQWMDTENKGMAEGHCSGFSITSLLFYKNELSPPSFGSPKVSTLKLPGNTNLQRRIAQSAVFQTFDSVNELRFEGTPNQVLDKLINVLKNARTQRETWTIGLTMANGTGGHAVTPYAVVSRGGNRFGVLLYDNNYPGAVREMVFNRTTNTWTYEASINPAVQADLYTGNATTKSVFLLPTTPGLGVQPCPFCPVPDEEGFAAEDAAPLQDVYLDGDSRNHAHLLITDGVGGRIGYVNGTLVREMPGARADAPLLAPPPVWESRLEPDYSLPSERGYTIAIDGSPITSLDSTEIGVIGPGYDLIALNDLRQGQQDKMKVSADGRQLTYSVGFTSTPSFELGIAEEGADHAFFVQATPIWPGAELTLRMDPDRFTIKTVGSVGYSQYDIEFERSDDVGDIFFAHDGLALPPNVTANVLFRTFTGENVSVEVEIIHPNGTVERRQLEDQS